MDYSGRRRNWNRSPLAQEYGFSFNLADNSEARRSRLRRLSTEQGQCRYLALFVRLMQERHPRLHQLPQYDRLRLLATAYNRSFTASWEELQSMRRQRHFHTDIIPTRSTRRYCYADIAVSFFCSHGQ